MIIKVYLPSRYYSIHCIILLCRTLVISAIYRFMIVLLAECIAFENHERDLECTTQVKLCQSHMV